MKHLLLLLATCSLLLTACSLKEAKVGNEAKPIVADTIVAKEAQKTSLRINDTLVIDTIAAVFYWPDTPQIEKQKKKVGEEGFYVGADHYMFYLASSREFLDSIKSVKLFNVTGPKFLKFVRTDRSQFVVKTDTLESLWGIFLFNLNDAPADASIVNFEEEYKNYFKK